MDAVEALVRLGGLGTAADISRLASRRKLRTAVRKGVVVRRSRDRYALPTAGRAQAAAARLHGYVSHLDAALHLGWEVGFPPEEPHVSVRRNRKIPREEATSVRLHWSTLEDDDVDGAYTSKLRTVLDCARDLPFPEALAVADSALRHGDLSEDELVSAAAALRGPGSAKARTVARFADGKAANPFESVLRALAIEEGLSVIPQYAITMGEETIHPDLADPLRGFVIEANSWTHHASRDDYGKDCARYNLLALMDWVVYRFTWEQVMLSPAYVRWVLRQIVDAPEPSGRALMPATLRPAA